MSTYSVVHLVEGGLYIYTLNHDYAVAVVIEKVQEVCTSYVCLYEFPSENEPYDSTGLGAARRVRKTAGESPVVLRWTVFHSCKCL